MLSYVTIYSALWENTACIIHLYSESQNPNKFVRNYSIISMGFVLFLTPICAMSFHVFGEHIQPVLIQNFDQHSISIKLMKLSWIITILGSYALMCFPVFKCIEEYQWYKLIQKPNKFYMMKLVFMLITMNLAVFFKDLTVMF